MLTVEFTNRGQDFTEWDIDDGVVVACRPFQEWVWKGTKVHNPDIQEGDILQVTTPDGMVRTLNYPIERVFDIGKMVAA